jgi:hypothetical protein
MIFMLFAVAIAALFFVGSLILLRLGQHLGLRYRKRKRYRGHRGVGNCRGCDIWLDGSAAGIHHRWCATAATTAYDRLALFGGDDGSMQRFDDRRQLVIQEALGSIYIEWRMISFCSSGR